jgi:hypothetical protein
MQGLADVNEVYIRAAVTDVAGVGEILKSPRVSRNHESAA